MKVQDYGMLVVLVVLVLAVIFKDSWFNALTEHTRDPNTNSKIIFLELE